jgi:hypothetical protein
LKSTVTYPLDWDSYRVSIKHKAPLLNFVLDALRSRDCRILSASDPSRAPFFISFETSSGDRQAILVYAFFANHKLTEGRPTDEHRFQIKYGGKLKGEVLRLGNDKLGLVTTLLIGIDTQRGIFVSADPAFNNPSPMSRSIEFKSDHVTKILEKGWYAWERDRREGKSDDRQTAEIADCRTEVLVAGTKERFLDIVAFERVAAGLDPGNRHLLADAVSAPATTEEHPLLKELGLTSTSALMDLIGEAARLKMAVRGWVAETHLVKHLRSVNGVTECDRLEGDGKPDVTLRWRGSPPILVECKNALRQRYADGSAKVDFQRTRASKGNPCSRYYSSADFTVLAACLHAVTASWEFRFALTAKLPPHDTCNGKIANMIRVTEPLFTDRAESVFYDCSPTAP